MLNVTPAVLTITAHDAWKTYGQTLVLPGTSFSTEGLVAGDQVSQVMAVSLGQLATALPDTSYPIVISQPTGADFVTSNYTISYVDGALSVIALPDVIPTGRAFDSPPQTVIGRPIGNILVPPDRANPSQLMNLPPDVIVDRIRPVSPVTPLTPSAVPPTSVNPNVSEERSLLPKPVLVRPRKQDRN